MTVFNSSVGFESRRVAQAAIAAFESNTLQRYERNTIRKGAAGYFVWWRTNETAEEFRDFAIEFLNSADSTSGKILQYQQDHGQGIRYVNIDEEMRDANYAAFGSVLECAAEHGLDLDATTFRRAFAAAGGQCN